MIVAAGKLWVLGNSDPYQEVSHMWAKKIPSSKLRNIR